MTTQRLRIACWIPKATNTHTGCVMLIVFHTNNGCKNGSQYYVYMYITCLANAYQ